MRKELVDTRIVWGFYQSVVGVSKPLVEYILQNGWNKIPPVPVFRVPDFPELRKKHAFMLLDGNKRRNAAKYLGDLLSIAIYEEGEIINAEIDGLAPSRSLSDPRRYTKLIYLYSIRPKLPILR